MKNKKFPSIKTANIFTDRKSTEVKEENLKGKKDRFVWNIDYYRYRSSHRMQFYKLFRLRDLSPRCVASNAFPPPLSLFPPNSPISFCPRDLSISSLSSCLPFLSSLALLSTRALTQFCNFNLIFARIAIAPCKQR